MAARWQLLEQGMTRSAIAHQTRDLRRIHDGVYLTGDAPITLEQRWLAATLTAPDTVLALETAAWVFGMRRAHPGPLVVLRPGSGGPELRDSLRIHRSTLRDTTTFAGIPITTAERTVAAVWPRLRTTKERRKLLREALRLERTTVPLLRAHLDLAPSRNAPRELIAILDRYERLQLHRCRSDAEAYAVELIDDARLPLPQINVRIAGEEADLSWPHAALIIEIDGDRFHQDKAEDARKTASWTAAGQRVRRASSDLVFAHPQRFVDGVRHHLAAA